MNEPLTIQTERVDDIPLLLAQMQRMGIARLLDAHFPTHGNREGLSLGMVTCGKCLRPYYAPYYHYCFQPPFGTTKFREDHQKP